MAHIKTSWATGDTITASKLDNDASQYAHVSTDLAAGNLPIAATALTGTIAAARLPAPGAETKGGVALPASATGTYYKDDGTWGTPAGGSGGITPASMIVTNEAGTYKCYSGLTGAVLESGATAATVIQYAIDNLTAGRTWKERVVIKGSITLSASIVLASYLIIQLDGKIKLSNDAHVPIVKNTANVTQVEICGGDWDGNLAEDTHGGSECRGITVYGASAASKCSYIYIHDLAIHDIAYDNIAVMYCDNVTVQNCHIYNAGDYAQGSSYWGHGLGMYYSSNCVVDHCHIHDVASGGCYFYCEDDSTAQTVNNNQITHNLVERTYTSGISFGRRGAEDSTSYDLHQGNIVRNCGIDGTHPGINVGYDGTTKGVYCAVTGNVVYCDDEYDSDAGIALAGDYCSITGNVVKNINHHNILIQGDYNTIVGNVVDESRTEGYSGIYLDGNYNDVSGNMVTNLVGYGIWCYPLSTTSNYNHIHGNTIDTADVGLRASAGATGNIMEGNVIRNTSAGYQIYDSGTSTVIRRNSGWLTEASGTATIVSGQALVNVTHGLSATPTKITATGSSVDTNALYINTVGSSTFRINSAGNVGGNRTVYWRAEV
jgi:hypothetical protein